MDENRKFEQEVKRNIATLTQDSQFRKQSLEWQIASGRHHYSYNFRWLGRPIIQYPQDILALQETIWSVQPDVIVETGIAHGGSIIFSASMLELIGNNGVVVGVDVDIRHHNRNAIESHALAKRIHLIEGSSTSAEVVEEVFALAQKYSRPLLILDSNHTHEHVLKELKLYSPLVKAGSYVVVFDTIIEDAPEDFFSDRPWGKGNNPKTAVWQFLQSCDRFVLDKDVENKIQITVAPDGFLKCIKD